MKNLHFSIVSSSRFQQNPTKICIAISGTLDFSDCHCRRYWISSKHENQKDARRLPADLSTMPQTYQVLQMDNFMEVC
ncbi:hypothetical protein E3N88_01235 [Mikania micrantha]|uniref:Uncharacterized protein n=1 Tax=Mikania micrantha TaxID=192012 RepID=A0A5N6Q0J5_9ASTR|nr:hypothetical protein E3N88_22403 [Mikania micrantha]KAD7478099.1 hypothetical protein E3N88_01235 [Mikania micrantha]